MILYIVGWVSGTRPFCNRQGRRQKTHLTLTLLSCQLNGFQLKAWGLRCYKTSFFSLHLPINPQFQFPVTPYIAFFSWCNIITLFAVMCQRVASSPSSYYILITTQRPYFSVITVQRLLILEPKFISDCSLVVIKATAEKLLQNSNFFFKLTASSLSFTPNRGSGWLCEIAGQYSIYCWLFRDRCRFFTDHRSTVYVDFSF